jgi:hypothetical protein
LAELAEGAKRGYSVPTPDRFDWVDVLPPPAEPLLEMVTDLGAGERAAIALAVMRRSDLLLLDDALARRHAKLLGLPVSGTLGVLLRAKEARLVPAVAPVLDRLESLGFRLALPTREAALRLAKET